MKNKFVIALAAFFWLDSPHSHTGTNPNSVKIGYASVNYILSEMPEYKQIEQQLTEYEKQLSNQLAVSISGICKPKPPYQQSAETMLPEIRQQKETELRDMQGRIEKFQRDAQQMIQKKKPIFCTCL